MRTDGRRAPGFEDRREPGSDARPARRGPQGGGDRPKPGDSRQAPPRSPRGDLRDLLGDFSEQTGSLFG